MSTINLAIFCTVLLCVAYSANADIAVDFTSSGERIVGGQLALPGRFPYQVALLAVFNVEVTRVFCSGTIIDTQWILTTAACVRGRDISDFEILAGATNISREGNEYGVVNIITHPDYNISQVIENNIALLQLATPLLLSDTIRIISLKNRAVGNHVRGIVSGWGRTEVSLEFVKFKSLIHNQTFHFTFVERTTNQYFEIHKCLHTNK